MVASVNLIGRLSVAGVEVLGRLCAGAVDLSKTGGRGQSELQRLEVAGFLAGLSRGPMLLAMAKYMRDEGALRDLFKFQAGGLRASALSENWDYADLQRLIDSMAFWSVSEVVDCVCPRCHGTRFVRAKVCPHCNGSGVRVVSDRLAARQLGIADATFRRTWKGRYHAALDRVRGFDVDVNRAVSRANWNGFLICS